MDDNEQEIPKFDSVEKLTDFFDENDLGDYIESMHEVEFEVEIQKPGNEKESYSHN